MSYAKRKSKKGSGSDLVFFLFMSFVLVLVPVILVWGARGWLVSLPFGSPFEPAINAGMILLSVEIYVLEAWMYICSRVKAKFNARVFAFLLSCGAMAAAILLYGWFLASTGDVAKAVGGVAAIVVLSFSIFICVILVKVGVLKKAGGWLVEKMRSITVPRVDLGMKKHGIQGPSSVPGTYVDPLDVFELPFPRVSGKDSRSKSNNKGSGIVVVKGATILTIPISIFCAWVVVGYLNPVLFSILLLLFVVVIGMWWLARELERRNKRLVVSNLGMVELDVPETKGGIRMFSWIGAIKKYENIRQGKIVDAMQEHAWLPYFYSLDFSPVNPKEFIENAGLRESVLRSLSKKTERQLREWVGGKQGLWQLSLSFGMPVYGYAQLDSEGELVAMLNTLHHGESMAPLDKGVKPVPSYFFGSEIAAELVVNKKLAPDIPLVYPVEIDSPTHLDNDVVLGTVLETETMKLVMEAGFKHEHVDGALGIFGGIPKQRIALVKKIVAQEIPGTLVIIDDHGDYHVDGAEILIPGRDCALNPAVPAHYTCVPRHLVPNTSMQHANLLTDVLGLLGQWKETERSTFFNQYLLEIKKICGGVEPPTLQSMFQSFGGGDGDGKNKRQDFQKSMLRESLVRLLGGTTMKCYSKDDKPSFDGSFLDKKVVVFDLSHLHGPQKQAFRAFLLLKMIECAAFERQQGTGRTLTVVLPGIDKLFVNHGHYRDETFHHAVEKVMGTLVAKGIRLVFTCQNPSRLPENVLHGVSTRISLSIKDRNDLEAMMSVLQIENERVHNSSSRHKSYQQDFLQNMRSGYAYMRRPDVPSTFIFMYDVEGCLALAGAGCGGHDKSFLVPVAMTKEEVTRDLMDAILVEYRPVAEQVLESLDNLGSLQNVGTKKSGIREIFEIIISQAIQDLSESVIPHGQLRGRAKEMARDLVEMLIGQGVLVADSYNPTGIEGDITIKLSSFGRKIISSVKNPRTMPEHFSHPDSGGVPVIDGMGRSSLDSFSSKETGNHDRGALGAIRYKIESSMESIVELAGKGEHHAVISVILGSVASITGVLESNRLSGKYSRVMEPLVSTVEEIRVELSRNPASLPPSFPALVRQYIEMARAIAPGINTGEDEQESGYEVQGETRILQTW
ncbi:MAG: hypothetical protein ACTSUE_09390 [Promethearchaeota archaeon]